MSSKSAGAAVAPSPSTTGSTVPAKPPVQARSEPSAGSPDARERVAAARLGEPAAGFLEELGLHGLGSLEPVVLAALATESPLLLIGAHGTAKSLLLSRIAEALRLRFRHYNASLVNFDDLVGYPLPDASGKLRFVETPASVWKAEVVFLDEISRCRPDQQNRLFSIVHEKRVQGLPIPELRHRWAAMNPPALEDDELDDEAPCYLGSEPLDPALADRFPFVVSMPGWNELSEKARAAIIRSPEPGPCREEGDRLRALVATVRRSLPRVEAALGRAVADWVRLLVPLLGLAGLPPSPRRARLLWRNAIAVLAAGVHLGRGSEAEQLVWESLTWSLPQRAEGRAIDAARLQLAHQEAWDHASLPEDDPRRLLIAERDPVRRCLLAARLEELSPLELSTQVADALAEVPEGGRQALALWLLASPAVVRLSAAVAEEVAILQEQALCPQTIDEIQRDGSPRHQCYERVIEQTDELRRRRDPDRGPLENVLLSLLLRSAVQYPSEIDAALDAWRAVRLALEEVA